MGRGTKYKINEAYLLGIVDDDSDDDSNDDSRNAKRTANVFKREIVEACQDYMSGRRN